jgi:hypothetical protein
MSAPVQSPPLPGAGPATSIADWRAYVKRSGGVATTIPRGDLKGELAARYGSRFVLAPLAVRKLDQAERAEWQADIDEAAREQGVVNAVSAGTRAASTVAAQAAAGSVRLVRGTIRTATDIASDAARAPREIIGSALGIPSWLVPVLLVGGAVVAVKLLAPEILPGAGALRGVMHHFSARD